MTAVSSAISTAAGELSCLTRNNQFKPESGDRIVLTELIKFKE
jgi:hypothetical protein